MWLKPHGTNTEAYDLLFRCVFNSVVLLLNLTTDYPNTFTGIHVTVYDWSICNFCVITFPCSVGHMDSLLNTLLYTKDSLSQLEYMTWECAKQILRWFGGRHTGYHFFKVRGRRPCSTVFVEYFHYPWDFHNVTRHINWSNVDAYAMWIWNWNPLNLEWKIALETKK